MARRTIQKAEGAHASLIFGILGNVTMFLVLPGLVFGILAIISGSKAMKSIEASIEELSGKGMTITGLILGIAAIVEALIWTLIIILVVLS